MILAGDIGGTKTTLALYRPDDPIQAPARLATFACTEYDGLDAIVEAFLAGGAETPTRACFGVAGPVEDHRRAQITNLPWRIDADRLSERFGIGRVELLNDLEATATVVPHLAPDELETLNRGAAQPRGTIAVVAPGTGIGIAFLVWVEGSYRAFATEGGHVSFAPADREQWALREYLAERFGHVSVERICSGSGIPNIYAFLRDRGRFAEPDWLQAELERAADPTPVLVAAGLAGKAEICTALLDLFVRVLGGVLGNVALALLATGGIYLGGGIPPRILARLRRPDLLAAIRAKGRFAEFCAGLPLHVILDPRAAVHGAAWHARGS
jgi:glucokinase